jgi:hypothetical protein
MIGFAELFCCCCSICGPRIDSKSVIIGAMGAHIISKSLEKKSNTPQPSTVIIHNPPPVVPTEMASSSTSTWEKFKTSGITLNVRSPITIVKEQKTPQSIPENNRWSKVIADQNVFYSEEHDPQKYHIELTGHHDSNNPFD